MSQRRGLIHSSRMAMVGDRQILLVSDGIYHPSLLARYWLRRLLQAIPGFRLHQVNSLQVLPRLDLADFQSMLLFFHHNQLSRAALKCLQAFVSRGGGLFALHSASASFKQEPAYFDILGGRFISHGPVQKFEVQPAAQDDEIFGNLPAFWIRDELYRHEYDPANRIHFTTGVEGGREPVVWTRRYGQGRVCYLALGHVAGSLRHPVVRQILLLGLDWTCGMPSGQEVGP